MIDSLEEFSATFGSSLGDGLYDPLTQSPSEVEAFYLGGLDPVTATGIYQTTRLRISGSKGIELFEFGIVTFARDIANAINATTDTTGVVAISEGIDLIVSSVALGADAFVEIEVLQDGDGPIAGRPFSQALGAGVRVYGTDAVPEPSGALILVGCIGVGLVLRRR